MFCCSMNCIVNHYTVWTDDTMIAIAEDRFEGMQNELSIPTRCFFFNINFKDSTNERFLSCLMFPYIFKTFRRNVAKTCSQLHQMCRDTYESTTSSQVSFSSFK